MNATVHDEFSLSKAHRWLACPGSVNRCRGIQDKPSEYAVRGTLIHQGINAIHNGSDLPLDLTAEDAEFANALYLAGAEEVRKWINIEDAFVNASEAEVPTELFGMTRPGFADWVLVGEDIVVVVDWKSGMRQVEARHNPQGAGYAVSIAKSAGIKRAVVIVAQPFFDGVPSVRSWLLDEPDLNLWEEALRSGKRYAEVSDVLAPGDHCTYCPARETCEARTSALLIPRELDSWKGYWDSLDSRSKGDVLRRVRQANKLSEEILAWVKTDVQVTGLIPEGFKIKKGATRKTWSDEKQIEDALNAALVDLGIPTSNAFKPLSPADLEKGKAIPKTIWGHLVTETRNEPSLVEG